MEQRDEPDVISQAQADVELLQSLAATHAMFGRLERGLSFLDLALWVVPGDAETLRLMAVLYYRLGHHARAEAAIRAFERSDPALPADLSLIRIRLAAGDVGARP